MKFNKIFMVADSPIVDRLLKITSEEDPDDESMLAGAGSAGLSLEDDPEREGGEDQNQGGDDDDGIDYKQRFSDTKDDRDRLKSDLDQSNAETDRLREENETLRSGSKNEEDMSREYGEDLFNEINELDSDDPDRSKKVYGSIGKMIAKAKKDAVQEIRKNETDKTSAQTKRQKELNVAERYAKGALKEVGLNPDKAYGLFQEEVERISKEDKEWFNYIPKSEQFFRIASKVSDRVKSNMTKNKEHRREAGGLLSSGSKVKPSVNDQEDDDKDHDTMIGGMKALKNTQRKRASTLYDRSR